MLKRPPLHFSTSPTCPVKAQKSHPVVSPQTARLMSDQKPDPLVFKIIDPMLETARLLSDQKPDPLVFIIDPMLEACGATGEQFKGREMDFLRKENHIPAR